MERREKSQGPFMLWDTLVRHRLTIPCEVSGCFSDDSHVSAWAFGCMVIVQMDKRGRHGLAMG